jgi:hypothetical protein
MAESALSVQLADLASEVGFYLGYGRLTTAWTGWQASAPYVPDATLQGSNLADIIDCVNKGYRSFCNPEPTKPGVPAHRWSFLTQLREFVTQASVTTYQLGDDYGGLDGELTYPSAQSLYSPIRRTGIGEVERLLQRSAGVKTQPRYFAIHLTNQQGLSGQRWQLTFAPTPDSSYTLTGQMRVLPLALSYARPWPLGGEQHAETILAACLAEAESYLNAEDSTMRARYKERLLASIAQDVQENTPRTLGYNGDRSDLRSQRGGRYGAWPWGTNEPTYRGVPWSQL